MSGSPKWSEVELQRQRERELREARQRKAEQEAARRLEAERRMRAEQIRQLGLEVHRKHQRVSTLIAGALKEGLDAQAPGKLALLRQRCEMLSMGPGNTIESLTSVLAGLGALEQQAERLAENLRERQNLGNQLAAELDRVKAKFDLEAARFEASGASLSEPGGVISLKRRVQGAVSQGGQTPESLGSALTVVNRGLNLLKNEGERREKRRARVYDAQAALRDEATQEAARLAQETPLNVLQPVEKVVLVEPKNDEAEIQRAAKMRCLKLELECRIAGLREDGITAFWEGSALDEVSQDIEQVMRMDEPSVQATQLSNRLSEIEMRAQTRQLAEERRAYIVQALQEGLRAQGFAIGEAVLVGDGYDGEVAFAANRIDRRSIQVNVPTDGPVVYVVDGHDSVTEVADDGFAYGQCESTEARLQSLGADLAQRFGLELGEILWENKDPRRNSKNANALPAGGPTHVKRRS